MTYKEKTNHILFCLEKIKESDKIASAAPLPKRNDAEEIIDSMLSLLFPTFFSLQKCNPGQLFDRLFDALSYALALVINYFGVDKNAVDITYEIIDELPNIKRSILEDVNAIYRSDPAAGSVEEVILCYPGIYAIAVYRISHELYARDIPLLTRLLSEVAHSKTGIDIHPGAKIGSGLAIDHGTGIVIGETSVIGDNVKIYQGVTIGARSVKGKVDKSKPQSKRHPTIGSGCTIYTNATILGGDTEIPDNSVIGSGIKITSSNNEKGAASI